MSTCMLQENHRMFYGAVMNFYDTLREQIRQMAEQSNLNQVAKKACVDRAGLKRFIDGERDLNGETLRKVIDNLGFTVKGPSDRPGPDIDAIKKKIIADVVTACWDAPLDSETRERIISAVTGKEPTKKDDERHRQPAVGE